MAILHLMLKKIDQLNDFVGRKISLLVLVIFGLMVIEVVRRYLFNAPSLWGGELVQMLFGAYVMLSGGYVLRWKGHISVDIIYGRLSRRAQAVIGVVTSVLVFLFCGGLLYYGGSLAWDSLVRLEHSTSGWNPPLYPAKIMLPIGALLILLQGISDLCRDIEALTNKKSFEPYETSEKGS